MEIFRVTTEWSGFRGGPGYTNFFFRNYLPGGAPTGVDDKASALGARERTVAFWGKVIPFLPNDVTLQVNTVVDKLEDSTGSLVDSYTVGAESRQQGLETGLFSAATGSVVTWQTSKIRRGRRIRGRTFIVPLAGSQFTNGGRLDGYVVGKLQEAGTALAIGGVNSTFGVWARPTAKGASDGVWAEASGVKTTDLPAVLRSRRD